MYRFKKRNRLEAWVFHIKNRYRYAREGLTKEPVTTRVSLRIIISTILLALFLFSFLYAATPVGEIIRINGIPGNWLWDELSQKLEIPDNLFGFFYNLSVLSIDTLLREIVGIGFSDGSYLLILILQLLLIVASYIVIPLVIIGWIFYRAIVQMRIKVLLRPTLWIFIWLGWKFLYFLAFNIGLYNIIDSSVMNTISDFTSPLMFLVYNIYKVMRAILYIPGVVLHDGLIAYGDIVSWIPPLSFIFNYAATLLERYIISEEGFNFFLPQAFVLFEFFIAYKLYRLYQAILMKYQLHAEKADKELMKCGAVKILIKAKKKALNLPGNIKFYIVGDNQVNAFAHACDKVTITSGTMDKIKACATFEERTERLGGVLGHELGHIVNHDIFAMSIAGTVVFLYTLAINIAVYLLYAACLVLQFVPIIGIAARLALPIGNLSARLMVKILNYTYMFLDILTGRFRETAADRFACRIGYGKSLYDFLTDYADDSALTVLEKLKDPHPKTYDRLRRILFWVEAAKDENPSIKTLRSLIAEEKKQKRRKKESGQDKNIDSNSSEKE